MVKVEEAQSLIEKNTEVLKSEYVSLSYLLGRTLAADILSPINLPGFNQSAMDGYALNYADGISGFRIIGEVQAGSDQCQILNAGECVRIFTGARVPDSANVVLQQEIVNVQDGIMRITEPVVLGKNIRLEGEQIKVGEVALEKGTRINAAGIGFIAGLGITRCEVTCKPIVSLVTTGNELANPGEDLKVGQIYESNSFMLKAALQSSAYDVHGQHTVTDDYPTTVDEIKSALNNSDVVIITGGISVGDYDFVKDALTALKVKEVFYKVSQKPGKPFFFGKKDKKMVFALPGNPAAALTCFYMYILPCLNQLQGGNYEGLEKIKAKLSSSFKTKGSRAIFLKGKLEEGVVHILGSQSSAMLDSFALANCLIYFPEPIEPIEKGSLVTAYKLV